LERRIVTVDRATHNRQGTAQVRQRPGIDPALALLVAVVLVLLALALGTTLFLLLPATF
jgi:hypothetical protein